MEADVPTQRGIAVSAVAADARSHLLVHVRHQRVGLIGRRIGVHLGGVIATFRTLASVRRGSSSVGIRKPRGVRIRAPRVPICLLRNVIAGIDVDAGAIRCVRRIEDQGRLIDDLPIEGAVAAIAGAVVAGVDRFEAD